MKLNKVKEVNKANRRRMMMKLNIVKEVREIRDLTQEELAKQVGCSTKIIDEIENGTVTTGRILAYRISLVLRVNISYLFPMEYGRIS